MRFSTSHEGHSIRRSGFRNRPFSNPHRKTSFHFSKIRRIRRPERGSAFRAGLSRCLRDAAVEKTFLLVAPTDKEAEKYSEMICFFLGKPRGQTVSALDKRVWYLPSRVGHKAQSLGKSEATARRIEALYALRAATSPMIVVTSALALLERVVPPDILMANVEYRVAGEATDVEAFTRGILERGYYRVSARGGIRGLQPAGRGFGRSCSPIPVAHAARVFRR